MTIIIICTQEVVTYVTFLLFNDDSFVVFKQQALNHHIQLIAKLNALDTN